MSNLNPLLKHKKIGRVLGWDDFQNPTKAGIKKALKNEGKKGKIGAFIFSLFFVYNAAIPLIFGGSQWYMIMGFVSILFIPLPILNWMWHQKKATDVSDEEIEEQLAIYEKWKNNK